MNGRVARRRSGGCAGVWVCGCDGCGGLVLRTTRRAVGNDGRSVHAFSREGKVVSRGLTWSHVDTRGLTWTHVGLHVSTHGQRCS